MTEWLILAMLLLIVFLMGMAFELRVHSVLWIGFFNIVIWSAWHFRATPEEQAAAVQAEVKRTRERERPVIVSEVDGCTVYRFWQYADNRYHFFTRCADKVTTESTYTIGKITNTESITTEKK